MAKAKKTNTFGGYGSHRDKGFQNRHIQVKGLGLLTWTRLITSKWDVRKFFILTSSSMAGIDDKMMTVPGPCYKSGYICLGWGKTCVGSSTCWSNDWALTGKAGTSLRHAALIGRERGQLAFLPTGTAVSLHPDQRESFINRGQLSPQSVTGDPLSPYRSQHGLPRHLPDQHFLKRREIINDEGSAAH